MTAAEIAVLLIAALRDALTLHENGGTNQDWFDWAESARAALQEEAQQ